MYSIIIVAGKIIDDPEMELDGFGKSVCTFKIVEEQARRDKETYQLKTISHQYLIKALGSEAESIYKKAKKGNLIIAEGRPTLWIYTIPSGEARGIIICNTHSVRLIDK